MSAAITTLERGLAEHTSGRLGEAERLYRAVLAEDPANADALHLLGMLFHQCGRHEEAAQWIGLAIERSPGVPMFYNNLATVEQARGNYQRAAARLEQALALDPSYVEALINLGNVLQDLGRPEEAAGWYRRALALAPDRPEPLNNLGNALRTLNRLEEAIDAFRRALALRPAYAEAWLNLSNALRDSRLYEEAESACREALRINADLAEGYANLGALLFRQKRGREAEAACRRAVWLKPALAEAHSNLAAALIDQRRYGEAAAPAREALRLKPSLAEAHANWGDLLLDGDRVEEALASFETAIRLAPRSADAYNKRGYALEQCGRFEEALASFDDAVRLDPELPEAHMNRGIALLRMGEFAPGWDEYEWRWRRRETPPRALPGPAWDGSPLAGRTILLYAEQGLGDTLQFCRYVPLVAAGGRVVLECQRRLVPLLESLPGAAEVIAAGDPIPEPDTHAPLLSLPRLFRTTLETIPPPAPLAAAQPAHRREPGPLRVGVAWAGNPRHPHDRHRSLAPEELAPLAAVEGAEFFSLQRGPVPAACPLALSTLEREDGDLRDTAAALRSLDLVITVDTMIAHLAGALGSKVWLLLSVAADWRWLLGRDDTPWYFTMRLFRQRRRKEWREVLERVATEIRHEFAP